MATPRQRENQPAVENPVKTTGMVLPNRLYMLAPGFNRRQCELLARQATAQAQALAPKLSGRGARGIKPYFGAGYFGVRWDRSYVWFQEKGIKPFTMRRLAGKVIPMWIDDPTGSERRANPKAKTRITANGRHQVLIFRKAAKMGAKKDVAIRDAQGRILRHKRVPQSYPGAPGRIARTTFHETYGTHTGKIAKLVPRAHVGVRWRHPGIVGREFIEYSIQSIGAMARIEDLRLHTEHLRH